MKIPPPQSQAELLARAERLAGMPLGALAQMLGRQAPENLKRHKGWVGQLLEEALGADAQSRAEPDFRALGIELKTLPVDGRGRPVESTFVCTIELKDIGHGEWERSRVRDKLARVLWIPVEGARDVSVAKRHIGTPLLWSLSGELEAALRADWEELSGLIGRGHTDAVTGHLGRFLQVRPKAASSRSRRVAHDAEGVPYAELPRGFYLRTQFTARLLVEHFALPLEIDPPGEVPLGGSGHDDRGCNRG